MVLLALIVGCAPAARPPATSGETGGAAGAVAVDHPLASEAGASVLRAGGNAVDAAVAAALAAGVVQPSASGLGGGGFAVVVDAKGGRGVLDFREVAPAAATPDMFAAARSDEGGLAVAVPSEGLGLAELHRRYGRLPLARLAAPAIALARDGFAVGAHLEKMLLAQPQMRAIFVDGSRRPALGDAIAAWADTGGEAMRTGWVARDFVDAARAAGGVLTMEDLAAYRVKERAPLVGEWNGYTVVTMPPPSSGGIALLQMLGAGATTPHCEVEAAKHAMADRAAHGGDPDFVAVDTAALLAKAPAIRADCGPLTHPPDHYGAVAPAVDAGTQHISVMDGEGMAVALTTTVNTSFGSGVIAPKSGIVLNDQMDDFATKPGQPNAFGLVQGEQNAVAPGKRPLSSMAPTVFVKDGRPAMAIGASGGPTIITGTYQVARAILEKGLTPEQADAAPRWHHQWLPNVVMVEEAFDTAPFVQAGHDIKVMPSFTAVQVVVRTATGFDAASEPRKGGKAVVLE
jgi:gamma-glutamyltranspeptidase/glutathione hydrolase